MGCLELTLLDDDILIELNERMHPVARDDKGRLRLVGKPGDLKGIAYLWDKKLGRVLDEDRLRFVGETHTLHTWAFYGFFKPTIAEVLTCIGRFRACKYYELIGPEDADDLNEQQFFVNNGFHLAKVKMYVEA